jgi:hypothetical protein
MKHAIGELEQLVTRWNSLRQQRPSEVDMGPWGYADMSIKEFDALFDQWVQTLSLANEKAPSSPDVHDEGALEVLLVKTLRDVRAHIDAAHGNGIAWLIQSTTFPALVMEVAGVINGVLERRTTVRQELLKVAQSGLNDEILGIETASPLAQSIIASHEKVKNDAEAVASAKVTAEADVGALARAKTAAVEEGLVIKAAVAEAQTSKGELTQIVDSSKLALNESNSLLEAVRAQKARSDTEIEAGAKLIEQANEKLSKALQDINRQGLAGAFAARAVSVGEERRLWMFAFAASIAWLLFVAWTMQNLGDPKALFDWHNLVRSLPLAAPAVWLGWYSARQSGVLARIQQDYGYKAATAVAFDSYKKEVIAASDQELAKQLLETTVRNFGDNPIRLFGAKDDHVMPVESLIASVKDDSTWNRLMDLLRAIRPEKK